MNGFIVDVEEYHYFLGISLMYDVIVIGAGPAGAVTARIVSSAGFRVLLLEKNETCRSPCAGYLGNTINLEPLDDAIIQSGITKMRVYFPDMKFHDFQLNGFVVDRHLFDMELVRKAHASGTQVRWNSPVSEIISGDVKFHDGKASGLIIVGADGVFSKTASFMGMERQRFAACAQYHLKGIQPLSQTCEIFFNTRYAPGGYFWIYPTGKNSAKVGVGVTCPNPRIYLDNFIEFFEFCDISGRLNGTKTDCITGALPIGGLREKLVSGNILLVGDSAGMADPITGAGIHNAILASEVAGKTIIHALEKDDIELLSNYETRIRRLLGKPLGRALEKRKKMDACSNNELLQEHLPELWVTFKGYWKECMV
jgi:digeranylgeranylglycerophospholipid reductase